MSSPAASAAGRCSIPRRVLRLAGTGLCVLLFWVGAALFSLGTVVILRPLIREPTRRRRLVRRMLGWLLALFRQIMEVLHLITISLRGGELPVGGAVVTANHPTLLDALIYLSFFPETTCLAKAALWYHPILGVLVRELGYLPGEFSHHLLAECVERARQGEHLLIFPEGTRSGPDGPGPFHRGAVTVAVRAGVPLIPVVVHCATPYLGRGKRWFSIPGEPIALILQVCYPFPLTPAEATPAAERAAAVTGNQALHSFFCTRLAHGR